MKVEDFHETAMSDFDSSFNIAIGISARDFDWFSNPYIEASVYELKNESFLKPRKDIKLKYCDAKEDLGKFMDPD